MLFPTEVSVTIQIVPLIAALALTVMLLHARQKVAFQKGVVEVDPLRSSADRLQFDKIVVERISSDPLQGLIDNLALADKVDGMIEKALLSSSVIGTIVLQPQVPVQSMSAEGARFLIKKIRSRLSSEDLIHLSSGGDIVIFVSHLKFRASLDALAAHLRDEAFFECSPIVGRALNCGVAMYPIDGYDAEALIDSARCSAQTIQTGPKRMQAA